MVIIAIVLSGIGMVRDVPYTGSRALDVGGAVLSVVGMGGIVLGILVWQEGGEAVVALIVVGVVALGAARQQARPAARPRRLPTLLDPELFRSARLPPRDLRADCCSRSRSAAR